MKKISHIVLAMPVLLMACSENSTFTALFDAEWNETVADYGVQICHSTPDAILYPSPWTKEMEETFVIPDATIQSMSTCGLLDSWLNHPRRQQGPWCSVCSSLKIRGVTRFNEMLANDRIAMELLSRNDCVPVLAARYLSVIVQKEEKAGKVQCLEMLLANDACISAMNRDERRRFLVMALKMTEKETGRANETRHILVGIMKAFNYTPFLEEAASEKYHQSFFENQGNGFDEWLEGYTICRFDAVEKYARQFLNESL
ncbi:MAG: hypothetical protein LBP50_09705 [Tannerella sp.]|jgi:hypothetical protein|nr:hypothetical protein [Tannerella sp.]